MSQPEPSADPSAAPAAPPGPARDPELQALFFPGFLRSIDFLRARIPRPGREGVSWARLRVPLVEGEETTPFAPLATLCDDEGPVARALVSLLIERRPGG